MWALWLKIKIELKLRDIIVITVTAQVFLIKNRPSSKYGIGDMNLSTKRFVVIVMGEDLLF